MHDRDYNFHYLPMSRREIDEHRLGLTDSLLLFNAQSTVGVISRGKSDSLIALLVTLWLKRNRKNVVEGATNAKIR